MAGLKGASMRFTIEYILANSHLPGPRGNLELLYAFSAAPEESVVRACLALIKSDTANSPEEFAGMCGIVGHAALHRDDLDGTLVFLRPYASHSSWRLREAVAMAVQTIASSRVAQLLEAFRPWMEGNALERRAVVAALCEPKMLKIEEANRAVLAVLRAFTDGFATLDKLTDAEKTLRQALGYGWSVVIAAQPSEGKKVLESYRSSANRHIRWIVKENLKKNRLLKLDQTWVDSMKAAY